MPQQRRSGDHRPPTRRREPARTGRPRARARPSRRAPTGRRRSRGRLRRSPCRSRSRAGRDRHPPRRRATPSAAISSAQRSEQRVRVAADADVAVHEQDGRPAALERQPVEDRSAQHRGPVRGRVGCRFCGDVDAEGGQALLLGGAHHATRAAADVQQRTVQSSEDRQVDRVRGRAPVRRHPAGRLPIASPTLRSARRPPAPPPRSSAYGSSPPAPNATMVLTPPARATCRIGHCPGEPRAAGSPRPPRPRRPRCRRRAACPAASTVEPGADERGELSLPGVRARHRHAADDVAAGLAHAERPESAVLGHSDHGIRVGRPRAGSPATPAGCPCRSAAWARRVGRRARRCVRRGFPGAE